MNLFLLFIASIRAEIAAGIFFMLVFILLLFLNDYLEKRQQKNMKSTERKKIRFDAHRARQTPAKFGEEVEALITDTRSHLLSLLWAQACKSS